MAADAPLAALAQKAGAGVLPDELPALTKSLRRYGLSPTPELIEAASGLLKTAPFANGVATPRFSIGGTAAPGFEAVRVAFEANFARGLERDAQLCIYHHGVCVVDLWGSSLEPGISTAPPSGYDGATLQQVWSSTKMMEATAFAVAVDRGWLSYSDKVSKHWPEYAQNGKAEHTVADVLRHDVGLENLAEAVTPADIEDQANPHGRLSRLIADSPPWAWPDGPDAGKTPRIYHGECRGFILNQILRRADPKGRLIGQVLADEIAGPLGADFFCGTSPLGWAERPRALLRAPPMAWSLGALMPIVAGELAARRPGAAADQTTSKPKGPPQRDSHPSARKSNPQRHRTKPAIGAVDYQAKDWEEHGHLVQLTPSDPFLKAQAPRVTTLDIPSCSGRASARGMARVMAMWAGSGALEGTRVLSNEAVAATLTNVVRNRDRNHEELLAHPSWADATSDTAFSQGGIANMLLCAAATRNPRFAAALRKVYGQEHWGWGGFGGSSLWFNRVEGLGFGYTITGGNVGVYSGEVGDRLTPILKALLQSVNAVQAKL